MKSAQATIIGTRRERRKLPSRSALENRRQPVGSPETMVGRLLREFVRSWSREFVIVGVTGAPTATSSRRRVPGAKLVPAIMSDHNISWGLWEILPSIGAAYRQQKIDFLYPNSEYIPSPQGHGLAGRAPSPAVVRVPSPLGFHVRPVLPDVGTKARYYE